MSSTINSADFYHNPPNHVIVRNDGAVFTSPIEPYDPPLPHDDLDRDPDFIFSFEPFAFRFNLQKYPQFAFIPKNAQFVGPLLGRLAQNKVVQGSDGRYGLEPQLLASWKWLEDTLAAAISCLSAGLLLPMEVNFYPYPREYQYRRTFKGKGRAIKSVTTAREAFVVMLGLFSMFYSFRAERHFHSTAVPLSDPHPGVQGLLRGGTALTDPIIQDLIDMESALGTRLGLIVVPGRCEWFKHLQFALAYAGVGFWVFWGKAEVTLVARWKAKLPLYMLRYVPDHQVLGRCVTFLAQHDWPSIGSQQLLMLDRRVAEPSQSSGDTLDGDVHLQDTTEAPQPQPAKRVSLETPLGFITRRSEEEKTRREKASPDELLKWRHRQRQADRNTWTNKSKVYHWPSVAGVRRRTRVEKNQIEDAWAYTQDWEERTKKQRKYSAVHDEWDICTDFDASEVRPQDDEEPEPPLDKGSTDPPKPSSGSAVPPLPPPQNLPSDHNEQGLLFAHALGLDDEEVNTPQLDVLMLHRYGFRVAALASDIARGLYTPAVEPISLDTVALTLMEKNAVSTPHCELAARHIVTLINSGFPVPDQCWDLKNDQLRQSNPRYFTFLPLALASLASEATLNGYTVNPTSSRYLRPWVVFFESSIAVAQCIREHWGPSLEDVISKACETGFRIHLFLVKFKRDLPPRSNPWPAFRPREREQSFLPSHFDFHAHQRMVQSLLEQPRLRAAVLRGGILSRICSPYVSLDKVAEGPSADALCHGLRWRGSDESIIFVEDFVSDAEIELLCGYFYVDNCEFLPLHTARCRSFIAAHAASGRAGQRRVVSFFPAPDVWEHSGIHTLAWSNSAEEKFRGLIRKLKPPSDPSDPTARPVPVKNKQAWKSHLRLHYASTKRFLDCVEEACTAFVESLLV